MDEQEVKDVGATTATPNVVAKSSTNVNPVAVKHETVNSINLLNPDDVAKAPSYSSKAWSAMK